MLICTPDSLNAVLLNNGNDYRMTHIAHATNITECYAVIKFLLQTPREHYAAELLENESKHVTKDSHSLFSLGLLPRKKNSKWILR